MRYRTHRHYCRRHWAAWQRFHAGPPPMSGLRSRRRQMSCCVSPLELHGWGSQLWNAAFHSTTSQTPRSWLSYQTSGRNQQCRRQAVRALQEVFACIDRRSMPSCRRTRRCANRYCAKLRICLNRAKFGCRAIFFLRTVADVILVLPSH